MQGRIRIEGAVTIVQYNSLLASENVLSGAKIKIIKFLGHKSWIQTRNYVIAETGGPCISI